MTTNLPKPFENLTNELKWSAFSKRKFLPEDVLIKKSKNQYHIWAELMNHDIPDNDGDLTNYIVEHAGRTFLTLYFCGDISKAKLLPKYKFTDQHLPIRLQGSEVTSLNGFARDEPALGWFREWKKPPAPRPSRPCPFPISPDPAVSGESAVDVQSIGTDCDLDLGKINLFCENQWRFLAKIFTKERVMEELEAECPLPLLTYTKRGGGGFSTLYEATIHEAHQRNIFQGNRLAIKEINDHAEAEKAYEVEVDALDLARRLDHKHIVKFVAGFEQRDPDEGPKRYLMFQWVDGGNLRQFWETHPWSRDHATIKWALDQIRGLTDALHEWHNYRKDSKKNCRHGDLKPENIVIEKSCHELGILQIADMGLARINNLPTQLRTDSGGSRGTFRYSSPESQTSISGKTSRSYDMWGLGCILLEFIIWLLYGSEKLDRFNSSFADGFFTIESGFRLQPSVVQWIEYIQTTTLQDTGRCASYALRQLLHAVVSRLLIADPATKGASELFEDDRDQTDSMSALQAGLPTLEIPMSSNDEETKPQRAKVDELLQILNDIVTNTSPSYFFDATVPVNDTGPGFKRHVFSGNLLQVIHNPRKPREAITTTMSKTIAVGSTRHPYETPSALDVWHTRSDNNFATAFFKELTQAEFKEVQPSEQGLYTLCSRCRSHETGITSRSFAVQIPDLNRHSPCQLCRILFDRGTYHDLPPNTTSFFRKGNFLTPSLEEKAKPIFSLVLGPGSHPSFGDIPKGLPLLPAPDSNVLTTLLQRWIQDCDAQHKCRPETGSFMPTRLIDVKADISKEFLRLDCSRQRNDQRYVALTHRWGAKEVHGSSRLYKHLCNDWEDCLELPKLPRTFRDAVSVTRSLGIQYLWIDSICIIQDDPVDKEDEIRNMENVFSSAYVTISATCSRGATDGFFKSRPPRLCHSLDLPSTNMGHSRIHLCEPIDNFERDVERSELSRRGWVFQERALSRRIIHFTDTQLYWECGNGIRCETLTKLMNKKTSFLSDPNFPESMLRSYKGMRILFFQYIYEQYSRLEFTFETDRAVGIAGIEAKVARVYRAEATFGILDDPQERSYLCRSLLWQRAETEQSLRRIGYSHHNHVPSWSWMAVMGSITYMNIPFETVEWRTDIDSPTCAIEALQHGSSQPPNSLSARARKFERENEDRVVFDRPETVGCEILKCVVFGIESAHHQGVNESGIEYPRKHYGLLVQLAPGIGAYERVGVVVFERKVDWYWRNEGDIVYIV